MSYALEIKSNGGFKRACGILLFNHEKHFISTTTMPIATKLARVLTYYEGIPPIKSDDPLITWSCEVM